MLIYKNLYKILLSLFSLSLIAFNVNAESSSTEIVTDLPHYVKVKDYDGLKVKLEDYSLEKSELFDCDIYLKNACEKSTSTTLSGNDISKFNLVNSKFNFSNDWGIGFSKVEVATSTLEASTTLQINSTSTSFKLSYFTKEKGNFILNEPIKNISLEKIPGRILLVENKTVIFIYDHRLAYVYDIKSGEKIKEIVLFEEKLDEKDSLSYIYFANVSREGKYLAWYIPFSSSRDYITYGFTEIATGKSITRKEKVTFDRVARSGNIFDFSYDENYAYFISAISSFNTLWKIDLVKSFKENKEVSEKLFTKDYMISNFLLDGDNIYYVANREESTLFSLYVYNTKNNKLKKLSDKPVSYLDNIKLHRGKIFYAYLVKDLGLSTAFYDTYTKSNYHFPITINSKASIDISKYDYLNKSLDNIVLGKPDATSSENLMVFLHGGPYNQMYDGYHITPTYGNFDWILERVRKSGSYVAKLDYPGSFGYGTKYTNSLLSKVGDIDIKSMRNSIDIIKKENKDIKNVYLLGISYGGYMVVKDYTENSNDYKEVFALAPVTDWKSEYETGKYSFFNSHFGIFGTSTATTTPEINSIYEKADLLKNIPNLPATTTLTVYQGTKDYSVDYRETIDFDKLMKNNSKAYTLNILEGQPHVFNKRVIWEKVCSDIILKLNSSLKNYCTLEK